MNPRDIAVVLKLLSATLPGAHIDEQTPAVWANVCATVDSDVGLAAANRMTRVLRSGDRFPSPADFLEYVKLVKQEREPVRALPEGPVDREAVKRMMAETRKVLAAQKGAKHWHGDGDDKCPTCQLLRKDSEAF